MPKSLSPFAALAALWIVLALGFIAAAVPIGTINQGDYVRPGLYLLDEPSQTDPALTSWKFPDGHLAPNHRAGSSAFLFYATALVQSWVSDHFDLFVVGLLLRLAIAVLLAWLALRLARFSGDGSGTTATLLFVGLLVMAFAAHNTAFLQSLYPDAAFLLGLPLLIAAITLPPGWQRASLVFVAFGFCAASKVQYCYLPLLLAVLLCSRRSMRPDAPLLAVVLLAQVLSLLPFAAYGYGGVNRHHSTYLGSYLAMTPAELDRLGIDAEERSCIGADAWGNRLESAAAVQVAWRGDSCSAARDKSTSETLRPYLLIPTLLPRLISASVPAHFTVRYFHLDETTRYVVPVAPDNWASRALWHISEWRDRLVGPFAALAICVLAWFAVPSALVAPARLLALFAVSQVPVVLLGEGVRDLSKHLAGAQMALDFLIVLMAFGLTLPLRPAWRALRDKMRRTPSEQLP